MKNKSSLKNKEEKAFHKIIRGIFVGMGFQAIKTEKKNVQFEYQGITRQGELDGIYIYKKVILIVEETCSSTVDAINAHLSKKFILFDQINKYKAEDFVDLLEKNYDGVSEYINLNIKDYSKCDYLFKILYISKVKPGDEYIKIADSKGIKICNDLFVEYFRSLVKAIAGSSRYELFNCIDIPSEAVENKSSEDCQVSVYKGYLLPSRSCGKFKNCNVISFYIDPQALLKRCFVLRKDGWRDNAFSYQRQLDQKKLKMMRKYLTEENKAYYGNIIASIPTSIEITKDDSEPKSSTSIIPVSIKIPNAYSLIGLIDGQHRVYSYYEGKDQYEKKIEELRNKQNLLITGIQYPEDWSEHKRIMLEASLFLDINTKQTAVKSQLTQEIQTLVNPYSAIAIARAVLVELSKLSSLKNQLEGLSTTRGKKLKVSSIIQFGIEPLVQLDENKSILYKEWLEKVQESKLKSKKDRQELTEYISFCANEIDAFISSIKMVYSDLWRNNNVMRLTPTIVNAFLRCFGLVLENGDKRSRDYYKRSFKDIKSFDMKKYRSSRWKDFGQDLYDRYFNKK